MPYFISEVHEVYRVVVDAEDATAAQEKLAQPEQWAYVEDDYFHDVEPIDGSIRRCLFDPANRSQFTAVR